MDIVNTVKKTGSLSKLQERLEEKESSVDKRHSGGSSKVCKKCAERQVCTDLGSGIANLKNLVEGY